MPVFPTLKRGLLSASFAAALAILGVDAWSLEDAQTLPRGVRRVMINSVSTQCSQQTNAFGHAEPMGAKLERSIAFSDFVKARQGIERAQLQAFLLAAEMNEDDVVGEVNADVRGAVNVVAPSFSIGITDRFSIGVAVPVYQAVTDVSLGFVPNQRAETFLALLTRPDQGQTAHANEAVDALNGVVSNMNDHLVANGYSPLERWEKTGLGDVMVKAKWQVYDEGGVLRSALNFNVGIPTGYQDDPDILTDIGFGDGSWDIGFGVSVDQRVLGTPFYFNQYALYTAELPSEKEIRLRTGTEAIAVEKRRVAYDLGDRLNVGASTQWDTSFGLVGGLGYAYQHKYKDRYQAGESSAVYQADTIQSAQTIESSLGYSAVNAFRQGRVAVPFGLSAGYSKILASKNTTVSDRLMFEAKVFF